MPPKKSKVTGDKKPLKKQEEKNITGNNIDSTFSILNPIKPVKSRSKSKNKSNEIDKNSDNESVTEDISNDSDLSDDSDELIDIDKKDIIGQDELDELNEMTDESEDTDSIENSDSSDDEDNYQDEDDKKPDSDIKTFDNQIDNKNKNNKNNKDNKDNKDKKKKKDKKLVDVDDLDEESGDDINDEELYMEKSNLERMRKTQENNINPFKSNNVRRLIRKSPENRITPNILSQFELTNIIATRIEQLAQGSPSTIKTTNNMSKQEIGMEELAQLKCPLKIRREVGNIFYDPVFGCECQYYEEIDPNECMIQVKK